MELTHETVKHIAQLARLKLSDSEVTRYQRELGKILGAFENLSKIPIPKDLEGDARSVFAAQTTGTGDAISRLRKDGVENNLPKKTFLNGAPDRDGSFVKVPAILERST